MSALGDTTRADGRGQAELEGMVAGMLSTIELRPAGEHPEIMLPMARQIIDIVQHYREADRVEEVSPLAAAQLRYPHTDGDFQILGPGIFADEHGEVINWKGENYVRQAVGRLTTGVVYYLIPCNVVARALTKARTEYIRVAEAQDDDPGPNSECWSEFEALAEYATPGDRLKAS